jgi:penicillin amidase|nr:penicillin acylase family protein [Kofleriaceae bacterium]
MRTQGFVFVAALSLVTVVAGACGDNFGPTDATPPGPFDKLPKDYDVQNAGLGSAVQVARDRYGIAHIAAHTVADASFAQGYVMAHDRLAQMEVLRRFGAGTLSELFGALDPSVIDTDLSMRVHRMTFYAQQTWDMLQASTDPTDQQIVQLLQRFADGVNAYAADLKAGTYTIDPEVGTGFDIDTFAAWTPVDSLVLGRFQSFALSFSAPFETDLTELYQKLRATYAPGASDPQHAARSGIDVDLLTTAPLGKFSTIDGFPNDPTDTGTRSDSGRPGKRKAGDAAVASAAPKAGQVKRPEVPQQLFDNARRFLSKDIHDGPFHALGPHAFMRPYAGSNNWAVSPALANGKTLLATDQHLQLPNPSIFYPMQLIVDEGNLDVEGVTFPGIPGIILGSNGNVAWAATVSEHDINDVYLENISPCGSGSCVAFNGQQVPITTFTENIGVGMFGNIEKTITATYEVVPHHGPIIPTVDTTNHVLVPRTGNQALSMEFTGYDPTFEIRAVYNLAHAKIVDDGFKALKDFTYGGQNWTMIDNQGDIAWTTQEAVPVRDPNAYTWNAKSNPDGLAPFMVLPGDGTAEWQGLLDTRYVPHAINPQQGYLATANADPVGATFDNDDLNQDVVDGRPLYVGVTYAAGVREERITSRIQAAAQAGAITNDDMASIQHDTHSNIGDKMLPPIDAALGVLDDGGSGSGVPSDVAPYLASLGSDDVQRLETARTLLEGWTGETPAATGSASAQDITDSAATAVFNEWVHFFLVDALSDEFTAAGFDLFRLDDNQIIRIPYRMLTQPDTFVQDPATGQPILCDDVTTPGDDSCTKEILVAMLDAMHQLETSFKTGDTTQWRWGDLHHLTITPLFPDSALDLPNSNDPTPNGFPKAGDNFVVNRADCGWSDTDFSQEADGPAQRFLAVAEPGQTITFQWALPGGTIYDSRDPHYRDLLDNYYLPLQHFDVPYAVPDIVANGEDRWEFHP